jgi:hypothetical protein
VISGRPSCADRRLVWSSCFDRVPDQTRTEGPSTQFRCGAGGHSLIVTVAIAPSHSPSLASARRSSWTSSFTVDVGRGDDAPALLVVPEHHRPVDGTHPAALPHASHGDRCACRAPADGRAADGGAHPPRAAVIAADRRVRAHRPASWRRPDQRASARTCRVSVPQNDRRCRWCCR